MGHRHTTSTPRDSRTRALTPAKGMLLGLLAIATFFLIVEHRAHLLGAVPYLLVLVAAAFCVLGHRHGHAHGRGGER